MQDSQPHSGRGVAWHVQVGASIVRDPEAAKKAGVPETELLEKPGERVIQTLNRYQRLVSVVRVPYTEMNRQQRNAMKREQAKGSRRLGPGPRGVRAAP